MRGQSSTRIRGCCVEGGSLRTVPALPLHATRRPDPRPCSVAQVARVSLRAPQRVNISTLRREIEASGVGVVFHQSASGMLVCRTQEIAEHAVVDGSDGTAA